MRPESDLNPGPRPARFLSRSKSGSGPCGLLLLLALTDGAPPPSIVISRRHRRDHRHHHRRQPSSSIVIPSSVSSLLSVFFSRLSSFSTIGRHRYLHRSHRASQTAAATLTNAVAFSAPMRKSVRLQLPLRSIEVTAIHPSSSLILRTRLVSLFSGELLQSPFVLVLSDSSVGSPPAAASVVRPPPVSLSSTTTSQSTEQQQNPQPLSRFSLPSSPNPLPSYDSPVAVRPTSHTHKNRNNNSSRPSRQSPPHDRPSLCSLSHQVAAAFILFLSPFSLLYALYQNQQQQ